MKQTFKSLFLAFVATTFVAADAFAQQPFTIKGNIAGIKNGTKVYLRAKESGKNIVSVSVDRQRKAWEKAMGEEKMTWQQYIVPATSSKVLTAGYMVQYIPSLVVIDPDGNIQLYTSDPDEAHHYLEEKIK